MSETASAEGPDRPELRLPADGARVSGVRAMAAALAAGPDLTIDDVDDLQIAVAHAPALGLPEAEGGADATCSLAARGCTVVIAVPGARTTGPDRDSLAWQARITLSWSAVTAREDGRLAVHPSMESARTATRPR